MTQDYNYTDEFKTQIAKLREAGKPISAIVKEYGVAKSTVSKWHHDYTNIQQWAVLAPALKIRIERKAKMC